MLWWQYQSVLSLEKAIREAIVPIMSFKGNLNSLAALLKRFEGNAYVEDRAWPSVTKHKKSFPNQLSGDSFVH